MSSLCKTCTSAISKKSPGLQCSGSCRHFFHANGRCCNVNKDQLAILTSLSGTCWKCENCLRNDRDFPRSASISDSEDPSDSKGLLLQTILDLKSEMKLLRESVTFCSDKVSDFEEALKDLKKYMKLTEDLKTENNNLKKQVCDLTNQLDHMEQYSRLNNLEIQGIPEKTGENLITVMETIGIYLNFPIDVNHIDAIHRVASRYSGAPRNIIVKFTSRRVKENLLAAYKSLRLTNKTKSGLKIDGISDVLYMNEHLTQSNKLLYKEARKSAKEKSYKYVWVKNGRIFLRKDDRSRITVVTDLDCLSKL